MAAPAGLSAGPTRREARSFALSVGGALLVVAALLVWRSRAVAGGVVATIGLTLGLAGLVAPGVLGPVYRAWMALALAISRVTTPLFMGVVYYAVLTPIGLVMRFVGRRPLSPRRESATYWVDRAATERRSDLRRQF